MKPLSWTLVTSVPTETAAAACQRLQWYATRWQIEVYHRTFKSGCRLEDRQLGSADRLETCLAIDLVVAWRVFWLTKQAREAPESPASTYFEPDEWKALLVRTGESPEPGDDNEPTLYQAMCLVAQLGGCIATQGEPGPQTIWRGLQRLDDITDMYRKLVEQLYAGREPP